MMKYYVYIENIKNQIQLEHTVLGLIRKKLKLYCIPLKLKPRTKQRNVEGIVVVDEGEDLIMDNMPKVKDTIVEGGRIIPWN
jgi:hypothetical protein